MSGGCCGSEREWLRIVTVSPAHFHRDQALVDLDRRTRAGRVMKSVIRELTIILATRLRRSGF